VPLSKTDICNMALGHVGVKKRIADIENPTNIEGSECLLYFETAVDSILESQPWSFAQEESLLTLSSVTSVEWLQVYGYPTFASRINYIINPSTRTPGPSEKVPFTIQNDPSAAGKLVLTDQSDICVNLNRTISDVALFPKTFALAVSYVLAQFIASPLRIDAKITREVTGQAAVYLNQSGSQNFEENQEDRERESEYVTSRN